MQNYKIGFLATTGPYWDHRYLFKQIQSLIDLGLSVDYYVEYEEKEQYKGVNFINLNKKQRSSARKTGGLNLLFKLRKKKYDSIQICNVELLPLGILLKLLTKTKVFYDCREDHISAIRFHKPWIPKPVRYFVSFFVQFMDFLSNRFFDGIILSDNRIFEMRKMDAKRKHLFYNMSLKSQFTEIKPVMERSYDIAVIGSMSIRTGTIDVISAVVSIKKKGGITYRVKIVGDPTKDKSLWAKMNPLLEELGKENYCITGRYKYNELLSHIKDVKIGVIPLLNLEKFRNNMATKQFEFMANGMPIIASDLPPQRIFLNEKTTLFYEPGNVRQLAEKIDFLLKDKAKFQIMSNNARKLFETKFNAEEQMKGYSDFILRRLRDE